MIWTGQLLFQRMNGVVQAIAGYSGGKQLNPTYDKIMDHSEALWIEYDPTQTSLEELLRGWTKTHKPTQPVGRQYRSVVWYRSAKEQRVANEVVRLWRKEYEQKDATATLHTTVEPVTKFYQAESYHQDYYIRTGQAHFVR